MFSKIRPIPHNKYLPVTPETRKKIARLLKKGIWNKGIEVKNAEEKLAVRMGRKYGCLVTSGTEALYLAASLVFNHNAPIAVPAYCCSAIPNALFKAGLKIQICDVNEKGVLVPPQSGCSGFLAVSSFGRNIENNTDLTWIEDSTHSDTCIKQAKCSVLSIWGSKYWGGDIGGAILCDDRELYEKMKSNQDYDGKAGIHAPGRLSDISGLIIQDRINREDKLKNQKKHIRTYYDNAFSINTQDQNYRYIIRVNSASKFMSELHQTGIMATIPVISWCDLTNFKQAKHLSKTLVSLPFFPNLKKKEQQYIISKIKDIAVKNKTMIMAF